jgi:hypothetical protein
MIEVTRTPGIDIGDSPADARLDSRLKENHELGGRGLTAASYRYQSWREKAISIPLALLPRRKGPDPMNTVTGYNQ